LWAKGVKRQFFYVGAALNCDPTVREKKEKERNKQRATKEKEKERKRKRERGRTGERGRRRREEWKKRGKGKEELCFQKNLFWLRQTAQGRQLGRLSIVSRRGGGRKRK